MTSTARPAAAVAAAAILGSGVFFAPSGAEAGQDENRDNPVDIEVFAPERGDNAGIAGAGWFIDMEIDFNDTGLRGTGFNGLQLTGPAGHNNIPPLPARSGRDTTTSCPDS